MITILKLVNEFDGRRVMVVAEQSDVGTDNNGDDLQNDDRRRKNEARRECVNWKQHCVCRICARSAPLPVAS